MRNFSSEDFTKTNLWRRSLETHDGDETTEYLKLNYYKIRDKVIPILAEIRSDFPQLTVHDISHVDSLWIIADTIAGENYNINPIEGFLLGCSFLIHDLALSYGAYGGVESLRSCKEWLDFRELYKTSSDEDVDFTTIRCLHAKRCKTLLVEKYPTDDGAYLMEDEYLREKFAGLIGNLASSHHWSIDKVRENFKTCKGVPHEFPKEWTINSLKIACLLRCADAAHLDNGRAPSNLLKFLDVNKVSMSHWTGQSKLSQVIVNPDNKDELLFSSTESFPEDDFSAWNVIYQAIKVCDTEIKDCNRILNSDSFSIKRVAGLESRKALTQYIPTSGWTPMDIQIKVEDVLGIINDLGGEKLYGINDQYFNVFRELLQNSRDAVIARKCLFPSSEGRIDVDYDSKNRTVSVGDSGVGMSLYVIEHSLLNFHHSFWHSEDVIKEFPGLLAKGFKAVGKYGIGFFSIFMISDKVTVVTKKFDDGNDNTVTVKFPQGITVSPIIQYGQNDLLGGFSTKIIFHLMDNINIETSILQLISGNRIAVPLNSVLSFICAGLDVDVYLNKEKVHTNILSPYLDKTAWLESISFARYLNDVQLNDYIQKYSENLDFIKNDSGKILGLAALNPDSNSIPEGLCVHTIGGLSTNLDDRFSDYYFGLLEVDEMNCSRSISKNIASKESDLNKWVLSQLSHYDSKEAKTGLTYSAMEFVLDTLDYGYVQAYYDSGQIIGPVSYEEVIEKLHQGGSLRINLIPDSVRKLPNGYICMIDFVMSFDEEWLKNNENDMVLVQHQMFCNRPPSSYFRILELDDNYNPVSPRSVLGCLCRKASEKGLELNVEMRQEFRAPKNYNRMAPVKLDEYIYLIVKEK